MAVIERPLPSPKPRCCSDTSAFLCNASKYSYQFGVYRKDLLGKKAARTPSRSERFVRARSAAVSGATAVAAGSSPSSLLSRGERRLPTHPLPPRLLCPPPPGTEARGRSRRAGTMGAWVGSGVSPQPVDGAKPAGERGVSEAEEGVPISAGRCMFGGRQADHEPAVCPGCQEGQWDPGVHQEERGQQVKGGSPSPLHCPGEVPSAALCPVLGSPVQER